MAGKPSLARIGPVSNITSHYSALSDKKKQNIISSHIILQPYFSIYVSNASTRTITIRHRTLPRSLQSSIHESQTPNGISTGHHWQRELFRSTAEFREASVVICFIAHPSFGPSFELRHKNQTSSVCIYQIPNSLLGNQITGVKHYDLGGGATWKSWITGPLLSFPIIIILFIILLQLHPKD